MATCLYFNIQLLPLNTNTTKFIGNNGYTKLFKHLDSILKEALENKTLHNYAFKLVNSNYSLVPYTVKFEKKYIYGRIRKFDVIKQVNEFYTDEKLYEVPEKQTGTSSVVHFDYCFDPKSHILVIENRDGKLPSNMETLEKFFIHIFENITNIYFKEHSLSCFVLKEKSAIKDVESSTQIRSINLDIKYSNPLDTEGDLEDMFDSENKTNNVANLKLIQKAEKGSPITGLTKYTKALLNLASRTGNATISYFNEKTKKWSNFSFKKFPVKIPIKRNNKALDEFRLNMFNSIPTALSRKDDNDES